MRIAPGKGRGHLCWWPLILNQQIDIDFAINALNGSFLSINLWVLNIETTLHFGLGCRKACNILQLTNNGQQENLAIQWK
jgi:hypothetical protein